MILGFRRFFECPKTLFRAIVRPGWRFLSENRFVEETF